MRFPKRQHEQMTCHRPPYGWRCSRGVAHDGPCAAWPEFWSHPVQWLKWRLA